MERLHELQYCVVIYCYESSVSRTNNLASQDFLICFYYKIVLNSTASSQIIQTSCMALHCTTLYQPHEMYRCRTYYNCKETFLVCPAEWIQCTLFKVQWMKVEKMSNILLRLWTKKDHGWLTTQIAILVNHKL